MAVTILIAVLQLICCVITPVTSTADDVMTGLTFSIDMYGVREDFGIGEDFQKKFIELWGIF
jgi:hypothetical protein